MTALPFSAVVGQDQAKRALVLAAAEPRLGGVLLRGQKGSAKTTLARGLAALLADDAPFVELPLGATEDRVLGSLDLTGLLQDGVTRFRPGLLASAHGGVLYVDEINLLADHLVDVLLDVAVSGVSRVEREGLSHIHSARVILIASMNPEEGELRPQLLDRFGLAVDIEATLDLDERHRAVVRQLAAERDPATVEVHAVEDARLATRLRTIVPAELPAPIVQLASRVAVSVGAEGLRADLMLCRAAAMNAAWEGRAEATAADMRAVAPMVLGHRRRRDPFEPPGVDDQTLDDAFGAPPEDGPEPGGPTGDQEEIVAPTRTGAPPNLGARRSTRAYDSGSRHRATDARGRLLRDQAAGPETTTIAVGATARAVAVQRATDPDGAAGPEQLRAAVREGRTGALVIIVVDTSGSMGADRRIAAAKGVALELLADAYQHRDRVAVVAFRGDHADVVLRPTASVEVAKVRLESLPTGGLTPLADALDVTGDLVRTARQDGREPVVVILTDGRATGDGAEESVPAAARRLAAEQCQALVVDAESGRARLGLAIELAAMLGAERIDLDDLTSRRVAAAVLGS